MVSKRQAGENQYFEYVISEAKPTAITRTTFHTHEQTAIKERWSNVNFHLPQKLTVPERLERREFMPKSMEVRIPGRAGIQEAFGGNRI